MEDEDYNLCEICYIQFDKKIHIPKIVVCCKNTFCIICLKSLFSHLFKILRSVFFCHRLLQTLRLPLGCLIFYR